MHNAKLKIALAGALLIVTPVAAADWQDNFMRQYSQNDVHVRPYHYHRSEPTPPRVVYREQRLLPGYVVRAGLADRVLPLPMIAAEVVRRLRAGRGEAR